MPPSILVPLSSKGIAFHIRLNPWPPGAGCPQTGTPASDSQPSAGCHQLNIRQGSQAKQVKIQFLISLLELAPRPAFPMWRQSRWSHPSPLSQRHQPDSSASYLPSPCLVPSESISKYLPSPVTFFFLLSPLANS